MYFIAAVFVFLALFVTGGPTKSFAWGDYPYDSLFISPLDTQGTPENPVYNPTVYGDLNSFCPWNDQDYLTKRGSGSISGTTTGSICLVADYDDTSNVSSSNYPKQIAFTVQAQTNTLVVSLTNDQGDSWTATPIKDGKYQKWQLCVTDPVADRHNSVLSSYPEISGSNGGRGQIVNYFLNIKSLTRTTQNVTAFLEVHGNGPIWSAPRNLTVPCPANDGI